MTVLASNLGGRLAAALRTDFMASVVVFLVALPLCMGIAIASGAPPAAGLITGIIGGLVVGFIAGSPLQVSGPAAGLAVIVWELIQLHGFAALGIIVLLAGVIQLLAGLARVGQWFRAVSPAVIHGMLAGIGVLIFASQFHVMVDDAPKGSGLNNLISIPGAVARGLFPQDGTTHHLAALIGVTTIVAIVLWSRFAPKKLRVLPAPLIAVIVAVVLAAIMAFPVRFIAVPDNLLDSVSLPTADLLPLLWSGPILLAALSLAVVASAETLLCATAIDQKHTGPRTNYDRELAAQGVGNILCGLVGALPMTGVIVRSSANVDAGAKTRLSAVLHGAWILVFVAAVPFVLARIPVAALAAVLVFTGYKLVNIATMRSLYRRSRVEFGIYLVTLVSIVSIDLLTGVMIGFGLSVLKLVYSFTHLEVRMERAKDDGHAKVMLSGAATFIGLPRLAAALARVPAGEQVELCVAELAYIDHACHELISSWVHQHRANGGEVQTSWEQVEELAAAPRFRPVVSPSTTTSTPFNEVATLPAQRAAAVSAVA